MTAAAAILAIILQVVTIASMVIGLWKIRESQHELHLTMNSRLTQLLDVIATKNADLLEATAAKNLAEGRAMGPVVPAKTEETHE